MTTPLLPPKHLPQHRETVQLRYRVFHHDPAARHLPVVRLLLVRQGVIPARLERDHHRRLRVVVLQPHIALVHHRRLTGGQLLQDPRPAQQRQVVVGPARHRVADRLDPTARIDHHLRLDRVRLLLAGVVRLLGLVPRGPVHPLLLAVYDDADFGERGHDLAGRAEFLAVAARAVEREVVERVEGRQDVADVELGVAPVQAEEEAEQLVGGVDAEPDQGHEEAVAVVMVVRVASASGALAGTALAGGTATALAPGVGGAVGGQEVVELVRGHAGETPEGTGVANQRLVSKHLATSALPDRVGRS
jgi:hypothetical protein